MPPPGAYDVRNFNIEKKVEVIQEEDPDLNIDKPPFLSKVERFPEQPTKIIDEFAEEPFNFEKRPNPTFMKKLPKVSVSFNIKDTRFKY